MELGSRLRQTLFGVGVTSGMWRQQATNTEVGLTIGEFLFSSFQESMSKYMGHRCFLACLLTSYHNPVTLFKSCMYASIQSALRPYKNIGAIIPIAENHPAQHR